MTKFLASLTVGAAALSLAACNQGSKNQSPSDTQTSEAQHAAGKETIASGLTANGKYMAAAKAAGLDQTLAGPGPYTVIVPEDSAFAALPAGSYDTMLKPENRAELTGLLTNMILSGTVLTQDISKAIDNGKGKALLATISGGTLTATKENGTIVLSDSEGHKANIVNADHKFSNGVVQHVNAVLMAPKAGGKPAN